MKLYIITIDERYECDKYGHAPIVKLSKKEALNELAALKRSAKKAYKGVYDKIESNTASFSLFEDGYEADSHYSAKIDEVEVEVPVNILTRVSVNADTIGSITVTAYPEEKRAFKAMKEQIDAEERDARVSGYEEIESETASTYGRVTYPSGDGMQEYQWLISESTL